MKNKFIKNRKKCIQELDNKCNPCKILTPNYGPKMGYEEINNRKESIKNLFNRLFPKNRDDIHEKFKRTLDKNRNEEEIKKAIEDLNDEKNILRFIYDEKGQTIKISNIDKKDKNIIVYTSFTEFVKDNLRLKNENGNENYKRKVKEILIENKILISKEEKVEVNKVKYNMNNICLILKGEISFGGLNKEKKAVIEYNVKDYKGLLRCESTECDIETAPIIKNIIIKDEEKLIKDREEKIEQFIKSNKVEYKQLKEVIGNSFKEIGVNIEDINLNIEETFYFNNNKNFIGNILFANINYNIYSGFLVQYICKYFKLNNCINNIPIVNDDSGGLCGAYAGTYGGNCELNECSNSGFIYGEGAGGLCASAAGGNNGNCLLSGCSNSSSIYGIGSGGLCGRYAGIFGGNCSFSSCENSGFIYGSESGGLCGSFAGSNGKCSFSSCENSGFIYGSESGGLCGIDAGFYSSNFLFSGCINKGSIYGLGSGGLCGSNVGGDGSNIIIYNKSINTGLIKNKNVGQLLGSIESFIGIIRIAASTEILKNPFIDNSEKIPFIKDNIDTYKILGDNTYYYLIKQIFNVKLEENLEITENIKEIIFDFAKISLNLTKDEIKDELFNKEYIFENLIEEFAFELRDKLLKNGIKLILE